MKKKPYNETDPSNIFCKGCNYWMARVHAKKVGDEWVCLDCLKKNKLKKEREMEREKK